MIAAMKILGFDCAGRGCAVAVLDGELVLAVRREDMERGQAERLMPMISQALATAGLAPDNLDLIAVTTGPGGFTGIRIGLATARGLALATGVPSVGVSNFAALAEAVPPDRRGGRALVAAIESKREELFLQSFAASGPPLSEGRQIHPRDVAAFLPKGALLLAGDAASRLATHLQGRDVVLAPGTGAVDPALVVRCGAAIFQAEGAVPPRPLYLRAPDTTTPKAAR